MRNFKILILALAAIFLIGSADAATIYGAIYDLSLRKLNNARVEINTIPKQFLIAKNGSYSFNVPNGAYKIKAQLVQKNSVIASAEDNITIGQDGSYVLDLILFPNIEEGVEDPEIDINGSVIDESSNNKIFFMGFIALFASGILAGIVYFLKIRKSAKIEDSAKLTKSQDFPGIRESKDESGDIWQVIKIIRQEGGRATQKDIRKQIPLSEAKISLMIAELEHKGIVEKIKKGRGNIIILKKK